MCKNIDSAGATYRHYVEQNKPDANITYNMFSYI